MPYENLHVAPSSVRDDVAVFTEPLAAAFRILEQVALEETARVIVLGDGKLGQLIAQVLTKRSRNVTVVGKHRWKLDLLKERGVRAVHQNEPLERGADVVVEATGSYEGFGRAIELVRPEGTVVLKTTVAHPTALELSLPVINEIRIVGSRCGPFRPALEALADGSVEVRPLVTETYDLRDAVTAFQRAIAPNVMKVVFHM